MATPYIPLPLDAFPEAARPSLAQLNVFLLEMSRLEGTIRQPLRSRRSDASIARRNTFQVDVTRVTPPLDDIVSGSSTVVGTPALSFSTSNIVGSTTTAMSVNSTVALFGTQAPVGLSYTESVGSSAFAARADHVHILPTALQSSANKATLVFTDVGTDTFLTNTLGSLRIDTANIVLPQPTAVAAARFSVNLDADFNQYGIQSAWTTGTANGVTIGCWDARFGAFSLGASQCTLVGFDMSAGGVGPNSGSTGTNNLYGIRTQPQITTTSATWGDVASAYFRGPRRLISSPTIITQAAVIVEPPTCGTTDQYGIYVRQQTAQAVATNRRGIQIDSQNSGTNRWCIYGVSDRAQFTGPLVVDGAVGLTGNVTLGNSITIGGNLDHNGTAIGLYGATPTAQFGTTGTATGFAAGTSTAVTVDSTFTGNTGSLAYTLGDCVRALKLLGALAY